MAVTRTSLSAACGASDLTLAITSTTGFPAVSTYSSPAQVMQVDSEYMLVVVVPASGTVKVAQRGYNGSKAVAHAILAPVITASDPADWIAIGEGEVVNRPPDVPVQVTIGADGAIAVPIKDTNVLITKASALAGTLAAPSKAQDGVRLTITAATNAAHVVVATTLLDNGLSGSPWTTATWGALAIGGSLPLMAMNGVWAVVGTANGVTLT